MDFEYVTNIVYLNSKFNCTYIISDHNDLSGKCKMEHYIRHECSERTIIAQVLCSLVLRGKGGCIIVIRLFIGIP